MSPPDTIARRAQTAVRAAMLARRHALLDYRDRLRVAADIGAGIGALQVDAQVARDLAQRADDLIADLDWQLHEIDKAAP
jgi:hypothetical protein